MILDNYMWTYPSFFTREEVEEIHQHAFMVPIEEGTIGNNSDDPDADISRPPEDYEVRSSKIKWLNPDLGFGLPEHLVSKLWNALELAKGDSGGQWNHQVERFENMQYTIYENVPSKNRSDFYTWHTDHGGKLKIDGMHRKFSMTVQLSDPDDYEGGLFQWLEPNPQFNRIKKGKPFSYQDAICTLPESAKDIGSVCIFPSFVHHQVTPVTRGTRISMVVWADGYPYV
tara:strand:+ start:59412 stop:60095 length:684 start_codon:yes stop_codon:yes gene_type:complete